MRLSYCIRFVGIWCPLSCAVQSCYILAAGGAPIVGDAASLCVQQRWQAVFWLELPRKIYSSDHEKARAQERCSNSVLGLLGFNGR